MGAVFRRSSSSSNLRYSRAASRSSVGDGLDGDGEDSADCAGESRVPRRRSRGPSRTPRAAWAASTAAGRLVEAERRRAAHGGRRQRPAADFWVAVVVLVAFPRVAVVAPVSSSSWRCRRRFRLQAPSDGAEGQRKPRSHASMAMVQHLSDNSASVYASACGCSGCVLVRFAHDPEIASVHQQR